MGEFVVASSNAAKVFDACKEALDQVAMLVSMLIEGALLLAAGARWNNDLGRHPGDLLQKRIGIERFVRDDGIGLQPLQQGGSLSDVMALTAGQNKARQIAKAWIFVLNPPRERPRPCSPFFWGRRQRAGGHARWCCPKRPLQSRHPAPA